MSQPTCVNAAAAVTQLSGKLACLTGLKGMP